MGFMNLLREEPDNFIGQNEEPVALLLPSSESDEDDIDEVEPVDLPQRINQSRNRRQVFQTVNDGPCRKCRVGRRWSRRENNCAFLFNLIHLSDDVSDDLISHKASAFEQLLTNNSALKIWEDFISQPEEEQRVILSQQMSYSQTKGGSCQPKKKNFKCNKYFNRICSNIKKFLCSDIMPKNTLLRLEPLLVQFFQESPCGQFTSQPLNINDRKVLHGLSQYFDLRSQSCSLHTVLELRCTVVSNPNPKFTVPEMLLSQLLGIR